MLHILQCYPSGKKPSHASHAASFGRVVLPGSYENHLLLWYQKKFDELPPNVELMEGFPKETPSPDPVKKEEQRAEPQLSDADVVEPIPRTMRPRATALLSRLKAKADVITWDKIGQVKIEGEIIPNSNISDLVSDAMRSRKDFNPTGAKEFLQVLSKLNLPKDLVRNQNRWKQLNDTPNVSTPTSSHRYPALKLLEWYKVKETPKCWEKY